MVCRVDLGPQVLPAVMAEKVILAHQDVLHSKFRHPRVRKEDLDFQVLRDLRAIVVEKVHLVHLVTKAGKVDRAAEVCPVLMDLTVLRDHLVVKVSRELTDYQAVLDRAVRKVEREVLER